MPHQLVVGHPTTMPGEARLIDITILGYAIAAKAPEKPKNLARA